MDVNTNVYQICRMLLADSLLKHEGSMAAVIDTTGNFDVLALYRVILARLQNSHATLSSLCSSLHDVQLDASAEDIATKLLDRVKMMRVFDFVGVKEAVDEIRDELEGRCQRPAVTLKGDEQQVTETVVAAEEHTPNITAQPSKRTVVADSEDEASDEEMLFNDAANAPILDPTPLSHSAAPAPAPTPATPPLPHQHQPKPAFLLLTNLAQTLTPLFRKNSTSGPALISPFLTTLSHLTRTYSLHTLLLNPTTTTTKTPPPPPPPQDKTTLPPPPTSPSIFATRTDVPLLLGILAPALDLQVLVGKMPGRRGDARALYGGGGCGVGGGGRRGEGKRGEMVGVMEVIGDRWGSREGGWGVFVEGEGGVEAWTGG
ncbi:hypothetical protein IAQ61_011444 [Plenodomus lingam]|uniref:uncharacterized protein n=1 Tax=Leptosphaeria maculans TaxID=5022 RepID=UPI003322CEFE|nr:hypothetical protein IAQ61_011444 [Plenodomus lingam]